MRISALLLLFSVAALSWQCGGKRTGHNTPYSQEDYVTERYLAYQDSLVQAWNMMMSDDDEKFASLHELLTRLQAQGAASPLSLTRFEERLAQLHRIRYTQKSMGNADVIEEYDFASTSLVREIVTLAESTAAFQTDIQLQQLVDRIRLAEERVENYRADYDDLVLHYNTFLDLNQQHLGQVGRDSIRKKARFTLVSSR